MNNKRNILYILMIIFASVMLINDKTEIFKSKEYKEPTIYIQYTKNEIEELKEKIHKETQKIGCEIFNLKIHEKADGTFFTEYKISKINLNCEERIQKVINIIIRKEQP